MRASAIVALIFSIIGALFTVSIFSPTTFNIKGFQVSAGVQIFKSGTTEVAIPPIGKIQANTHLTPVKIKVVLENIDLKLLKATIDKETAKEKLLQELKTDLIQELKNFTVRVFVLAIIGSLAAMLILRKKNLLSYLKSVLVAFLTIGALFYGTYASYDIDRFQTPQFQGIIKAAPWMMRVFEESLVKAKVWNRQMEVMAGNLYTAFEKIDKLSTLDVAEGDIKVLHVSDIHNNPAAFSFIKHIVKNFTVDLIVDTGDLTDYGTPLEAKMISKIQELKVPYLITLGNHDSPEIGKELSKVPNVIKLNGETWNIYGLSIMGLPDPAAKTNDIDPPPEETNDKQAKRIKGLLQNSKNKPIILAVHNPGVAKKLQGQVPVILFGHNHKQDFTIIKNSAMSNAGTTGAAGLRGLQGNFATPYTLTLLTFKRNNHNAELAAVDLIKVENMDSGFTLERKILTSTEKKASVLTPSNNPEMPFKP